MMNSRPAHEAEAGPNLVTKLGLNLVQVQGQLPVRANHLPGDGGNHLFVGGA